MSDHEILIEKLKQIRKDAGKKICERHNQFFKLVLEKQYGKALQYATKALRANDFIQIELLHTLLIHIANFPSKNIPEFGLDEVIYVLARNAFLHTLTSSLPNIICPKFNEEESKLLKESENLLKNRNSNDQAKLSLIKRSLEHVLKISVT